MSQPSSTRTSPARNYPTLTVLVVVVVFVETTNCLTAGAVEVLVTVLILVAVLILIAVLTAVLTLVTVAVTALINVLVTRRC